MQRSVACGILAGAVCGMRLRVPPLPAGLPHKMLGVLCALGALASWTWFAVENARYLKRNAHFDSNEWSVLWGVVTGLLGAALWIAVAALPAGAVQDSVAGERWAAVS